jgi:hypothetical protein
MTVRDRFRRIPVAARVLGALLAVALLAGSVVVVGSVLGGGPRQDAAAATADATATDATAIQANEEVLVDVTTLLDGEVWRTTEPYLAQLLQYKMSGNLSGFDESSFVPTPLTAGQDVKNNPVLTALAQALPGHHAGDHFEMKVIEPFGPASEVKHLDLPRWWGPYERDASWTLDAFNASFGAPPELGDSVATNKLFNSTVVSVGDSSVVLRSEAQDGQTVALPYFNAFLRVFTGSDGKMRFRIDPVQNASFRVQDGRTYFGLPSGQYVATAVTEDTISYLYHPQWSPFLVGLNFDLLVDIRPAGYHWSPTLTQDHVLPAHGTTNTE